MCKKKFSPKAQKSFFSSLYCKSNIGAETAGKSSVNIYDGGNGAMELPMQSRRSAEIYEKASLIFLSGGIISILYEQKPHGARCLF